MRRSVYPMRRARRVVSVSRCREARCWASSGWASLPHRAGVAGRACAPWVALPHRLPLAAAHRSWASGAAIEARKMALTLGPAPRPRAHPSWAGSARHSMRRGRSAAACGAAHQAATMGARAPREPREPRDLKVWREWREPRGYAGWAARQYRWWTGAERQMERRVRVAHWCRARPTTRRWRRPAGGMRPQGRGRTRPVCGASDRRRASAGRSFAAGWRACAGLVGLPRWLGSPGPIAAWV